jgi:hypothetical protein
VLIDSHRVVHKVLICLTSECVLEILRVQLVEWVLSKSDIVVDQVRVLKVRNTGGQLREFNLIEEYLRVEVGSQWINLNNNIMKAWVCLWRWDAEHVEPDLFLVGSELVLLLHSPLQEDWMLVRESVIEVVTNIINSTLLNQLEADLRVLTRS